MAHSVKLSMRSFRHIKKGEPLQRFSLVDRFTTNLGSRDTRIRNSPKAYI